VTPDARRSSVPAGLATSAAFAWRLLIVVVAAYLVGNVLLRVRLVVIPFVLGAAIAALLYRQVDWLDRHRLPRSLASLLVTLGWTASLIGALVLLGMTVSNQVDNLTLGISGGLERLRDYLASFGVDALRLSVLQESFTSALMDNRQALSSPRRWPASSCSS